MRQIVITLTEEQEAIIKLAATAVDAKEAKKIIAAMDATDSVELDMATLAKAASDKEDDINAMIIGIGILASSVIAKKIEESPCKN